MYECMQMWLCNLFVVVSIAVPRLVSAKLWPYVCVSVRLSVYPGNLYWICKHCNHFHSILIHNHPFHIICTCLRKFASEILCIRPFISGESKAWNLVNVYSYRALGHIGE